MKVKGINKKMIAVTMLVMFIISIFGVGSYVNATDDLIDVNRTVSVSNVKANDTFDVKYTITPKSIAATSQDNNKQKEIVFVMDTSGSMDWAVDKNRKPDSDKKSRLDIMKEVAKNFIDKFKNNAKARISLIEYNNWAEVKNDLINIKSNNITDLKNTIEGLSANGSTNIGDGLRKAYYMISGNAQGQDKYIVLMTDGEAEAYSYYNYRYYMGNSERYHCALTQWVYWNGNKYANPDYRQESMEYAQKVASELIANPNDKSKINTFVIGFGSGANGDKNKQIADSAKGTYFQAQDENTVNEIYDKIQKIIETNVNGTVHFEENISSNLEVVEVKNKDLSQEFKINNNKLIIDVNNYYTLTGKNYTSDPIEFTVKYKVKDNDLCKLGAGGNSSFVKLDVLGKTDKKYLEEKIIGNLVPTQVTMEVSDTTGIIDKYDTAEQNPPSSRYDKVENQYKLLGDSYINIQAQGGDINFMQYQFVKSDTKPNNLPNDNWKEIDLTNEEINEDVDVERVGNLTQRSYDVSHLPTLTGNSQWSDPNLVFKYPFEATAYKSTEYSTTKEAYGHWENYIKPDNTQGRRWVTSTAFLNNMWISEDYKEASKFWGYLKVPQDGDYHLGVISDDGCKADITIDGTTNTFVNCFYPKSASSINSENGVYTLKANKYYPIYIEYFNWGGSAALMLQYQKESDYGDDWTGWSKIPYNWFYPSKSTAPGEYATNRFTGRTGVKIPEKIGKYYIAYRTGKRDANNTITEIQKSGFYGSFIRDERFVLSRSLNNNGADRIGDNFEINYIITPNDIPITDIYKNYHQGDTIANTLTISNLKIQDVLPNGLTYGGSSNNVNIVDNSHKISGAINSDIAYKLVGSTYKASPVTITIKVKPTIEGMFNLSREDSILTYTDISIDAQKQGAQRQCYFPDFSFSVNNNMEVTHGLYKGIDEDTKNPNSIIENIENSGKTFAKGSTVTLGAFIDGVRNEDKITLELAQGVTKIGDIKVFKVNDSGIVEPAIGIMELENGKYTYTISGFSDSETKVLVRYTEVLPTEEGSYTNTIKVGSSDGIPATVTIGDEELPDLF